MRGALQATVAEQPADAVRCGAWPNLAALLRPPLQLIDWALLPRAALGVLALLCGNGYIVGINQARASSRAGGEAACTRQCGRQAGGIVTARPPWEWRCKQPAQLHCFALSCTALHAVLPPSCHPRCMRIAFAASAQDLRPGDWRFVRAV